MKRTNKLLALFLALVMLLTSMAGFSVTAFADEYEDDILGYYPEEDYEEPMEIEYNTYSVKGGVCICGIYLYKDVNDLVIPSTIDGKKVVELSCYIDGKCTGDIVIPATVKKIEGFYSDNINGFRVSSKNKYYSAKDGVLFNKDKTVLLCYPSGKKSKSYTIPSTVKTVKSDAAWANRYLTKLTIPNSVTTIGGSNFSECSKLQTISIGSGLKKIGDYALNNNPALKSYKVSSKNKYYSSKDGVLFNKKKSTLISYPVNKSGKSYKLPKTVKTVGENAFSASKYLTKVTLSDKLTTIKYNAFYGCKKLTTVENMKNVKSIGDGAFDSSGIKSIKLPKTVAEIGYFAFADCEKLSSVDLSKTELKTISSYSFVNSSVKSVKLPKTATEIGYFSFASCSKLSSIDMSETKIAEIKDGAFEASAVKTVKLPSTCTKIGTFTFASTKIENITIPSSVKLIDEYAFDGCKSLKTVTIKGKKTKIGSNAFTTKKMKIKAPKDSKAQKYAKKHKIKFEKLK